MISIGEQISHYRIIDQIGGGGMGIVYKAEDLKLNRVVALKFLPPEYIRDPDSKRRFVQEARAASAIQHSNICTIHDIEEIQDNQMFICMDYYEGDTLKTRLNNAGISFDKAIDLAIQIADGLEYAHRAGIVHRDIKPANIIVTGQEQIKILDFGLVKLAGQTTISVNGSTVGTIAYMSPEQARAETVDHRTDIWAVGVILYEMLTGQHPFNADYDQAMIFNILNEDPVPPVKIKPGLPKTVNRILEKCLQKDVINRYQSISELKNDLNRLKQNKRPAITFRLPDIFYHKKYRWIAYPIIMFFIAAIIMWASSLPSGQYDNYLAVVPFTNISEADTNQIYCDALTEILTNKLTELGKVQGALFIIPAVDVRKYGVTSSAEALQIFNARLAVTGSLQRENDNLRLLISLVDTRTRRQIHSADLQYKISALDKLEEEMLVSLLDMLEIQLSPQVSQQIMPARVQNSDAYDYYLQGLGYLQRFELSENVEKAINYFNRAVEQDSLYALAWAGLGEAHWRKYEADKNILWSGLALKFCEKAQDLEKENIRIHTTMGIIYNGTGQYERAHAEFDLALTDNPADAKALRGRAAAFEGQGDLEMAERTYVDAIRMQPDYWAGYNNLGVFYYRQGLYTEAIEQFEKVIEKSPQNPKGYNNLGAMYFFQDKWDEAIQFYEKALAIKPESRAYSNLGALYYYKNDFTRAAQAFKKALEFDQNDYRLWGNLADCYHWQLKGEAEAHLYYSKSIELGEEQLQVNPNNTTVMSDLAGYYEGVGDEQNAREMVRRVIAQNTDNPEDIFNICDTFEQLGEREQALIWMEKLLASGYPQAKIRSNPAFTSLREDPQYSEILKNQSGK